MDRVELAKSRLPLGTFMPVLPWALGSIFGLTAALLVARGFDPLESFQAAVAATLGGGAVAAAVCLLCALTYPVTVYSSGIASYNPWGSWKREFMPWEAMSEIHRTKVFGVHYLKIDSLDGSNLWIPQRVLEIPSLASAIREAAPPGLRLVQFITHAA